MLNKIQLKSILKIPLKMKSDIFKYFIFLTYTYGLLKNLSFGKAAKLLQKENIYEQLYLSNYFHDSQSKLFDTRIFNFKETTKSDYKKLMDSFWLLLEKDIWFENNKAIHLFRNKQKSFSEQWNTRILDFLEQHKIVLKNVNKIFKYDISHVNIKINQIVNKKY